MTQKVVVNHGYGGYSLSEEAVKRLREMGCEGAEKEAVAGEYYSDGSGPKRDGYPVYPDHIPRDAPELVALLEEGEVRVGGPHASPEVVEVPDGVEWVITEYDGAETLREKHRVYPGGEYAGGVASSYDTTGERHD